MDTTDFAEGSLEFRFLINEQARLRSFIDRAD